MWYGKAYGSVCESRRNKTEKDIVGNLFSRSEPSIIPLVIWKMESLVLMKTGGLIIISTRMCTEEFVINKSAL
jgi:hypothetical protein